LIPYPNGKFLGANIPGARFLTYPNVGHLPTIEAADKFNKEVLEFLA
ncbi:MAG: alpha/beta hydrolase, partial [Chloroflexi bacterium]|nr:alpha/beta hydrolase [Chloroflexota bacterium]